MILQHIFRAEPPQKTLQVIAALTVTLVLGFMLFARLDIGQPANEDFAVYLQEAMDIARGVPFGDMGINYSLDRDAPLRDQGPLTYPALVPALYAPAVSAFGLDFNVLKGLQLGFAILAFGLLTGCSSVLGFTFFEACLSAVVLSLFVPFSHQINSLGSDLPFLAFLVLAILSIEIQIGALKSRSLLLGILTGATIFLAFDARTVGVVLLPVGACAQLLRQRLQLHLPSFFAPALTFALLWVIQYRWNGQSAGYGYVLHHHFFGVVTNLKQFYWDLARPWANAPASRFCTLLLIFSFGLAAVGVLHGLWRGQAAAVFTVAYLGLLLILPSFNAGLRYLYPVLLFWGAFAARGAVLLLSLTRIGETGTHATLIAMAGAMLCLLITPSLATKTVLPYGALTRSSTDLFRYLQTHVRSDSVVAAHKYRAAHLFSQRHTIRPPLSALKSAPSLYNWLESHHVKYAVLKKTPSSTRMTIAIAREILCAERPPRGSFVVFMKIRITSYSA
jgi:hypothetical protein